MLVHSVIVNLRSHPRAERLTFDERHREIREAVRVAGREKWNDVRLLKLRG
jgi:hypothetical protein